MCGEGYLGENPKGFPTQRAAPEEEYQLRWVGGFSSHELPPLLLVQVLCVTLVAVCTWDEKSPPLLDIGCLVWSLFGRSFSCANCFREWWAGEFRPEDGGRKDRGVAARVERDRAFYFVHTSRVRGSNSVLELRYIAASYLWILWR